MLATQLCRNCSVTFLTSLEDCISMHIINMHHQLMICGGSYKCVTKLKQQFYTNHQTY